MIKRAVIFICLIALLSGCSMLRMRPAMQDELQNVADCFFDAVSILQREPAEPASFATFLREAKAKQESKGNGNFALLRWDDFGKRLRLSQGPWVFCKIVKESHSDYTDGRSSTFVTYEFFTKEPVPPARTTISLWYGGTPE